MRTKPNGKLARMRQYVKRGVELPFGFCSTCGRERDRPGWRLCSKCYHEAKERAKRLKDRKEAEEKALALFCGGHTGESVV